MKPSALRFLACPSCRSGLDLAVETRDGEEVLEGNLTCRGCGAQYAVRRGVPRFVRGGAYAGSFGRQWRWFRRVQLDSLSHTSESERALVGASGWSRQDCAERLVLDAGVGAGRFAEVMVGWGAEVVGVDLTDAVDAAFDNLGRHPRVHLVQADIFALPFRPGTFDLAYSIGVLHHTPDPRAAFNRVATVVREGGQLAAYVYARYGPAGRFSDFWRRITTRLPLPVMRALAFLAVPAYYLYRIPLIGHVLRVVCPISMHPRWRWRWLDTFDWYTPKYQWKLLYPEVHDWFRSEGFFDLLIFDGPIRIRGTRGRRITTPAGRQAAALPTSDLPPEGGSRIVALGGGTGLPIVLAGLKDVMFPNGRPPDAERERLTAIVTVADDGGSSGRLRAVYDGPAPGDLRNCLLALDGDGTLAPLFRFRFPGDQDVGGHSLGNLILTALSQVQGDIGRAVDHAGNLLGIRGRVLPATTAAVTVVAELDDGTERSGEAKVGASSSPIRQVRLEPAGARVLAQAEQALRAADLIVIGPGSLYTSLLPVLLVPGIAEAIVSSSASVVLVMNLMTEPGETAGYSAADHVQALRRHLPALPIHAVLVNVEAAHDKQLRRYARAGAEPVQVDYHRLLALGPRVVVRALMSAESKVRHDPARLAAALMALGAARPAPSRVPMPSELEARGVV